MISSEKIIDINYKKRTLIYSFALMTLFLIFLGTVEFFHVDFQIEQKYRDIHKEVNSFLKYKEQEISHNLQQQIKNILQIEGLKNAIKIKDKELIYNLTSHYYKKLKLENPYIKSFHFYDSVADSLIKVNTNETITHKNLKKRISLKKVLKTQKSSYSFEESCFGIVFRVLEPIFNENNQFIGIVELAISPLFFEENIKKLFPDIEIGILIKEEDLIFERSVKIFDEVQDYLILNSDFSTTMRNILELANLDKKYETISYQDIYYLIISSLELPNFKQEQQFKFVFMKSIDSYMNEFYKDLIFLIGIASVSMAILFIFVFYVLQRFTRHIKLLNDDLTERNSELDAIFKMSRVGIAILDLETNFIDFNKAYLNMTGFTEEELKKLSCFQLTAQEDLVNTIRATEKLMKKGYVDLLAKSCIMKGNKKVFIHLSAVYLKQKEQILISVRNMSKFQTIQNRLERSEEKFRTLVGNILDTVYRSLYDEERTMLYISKNILHLTGYTAEELTSIQKDINFFEMVHESDRKDLIQNIEYAVERRKPYSIEYRIISRHGRTFWVLERGKASYNEEGEVVFLDGIISDITSKKVANKKLQEYMELVDSNVIISSTDLKGRITDVSKEEILGSTHNILKSQLNTPDLYKNMWENIIKGKVWKGELQIRTKSNELKWIYAIISPTFDLYGERIGYTAIRQELPKPALNKLNI